MLSNQMILEKITTEIYRLTSEIEVAQNSLNSDLSAEQKEQLQQNILSMSVMIAKLQKDLELSDDYQNSLRKILWEKQDIFEKVQEMSLVEEKDYADIFYPLGQRILQSQSMLELEKSIKTYNKKYQEFLLQSPSKNEIAATIDGFFKTLIKYKEDYLVQLSQPVEEVVELSAHEIAMNKLRAIKAELEQNAQKISSAKLYAFYGQLGEIEEECKKEFLFSRVNTYLSELIADRTLFLQQIQTIKDTLAQLDAVVNENSKNLLTIAQIHEAIPRVIPKVFSNFEDDDVVTVDAVSRLGNYINTSFQIEKMKDLQKEVFLYFENKIRTIREKLEYDEAMKKCDRDLEMYYDDALTFGLQNKNKTESIQQSQPSVKSIYDELEESPDLKKRNPKLKVVPQQKAAVKESTVVPNAAGGKLGVFGALSQKVKSVLASNNNNVPSQGISPSKSPIVKSSK